MIHLIFKVDTKNICTAIWFLVPSGAQGILMSVCPTQVYQELSIFILTSFLLFMLFSQLSISIQRHTDRAKILCLVYMEQTGFWWNLVFWISLLLQRLWWQPLYWARQFFCASVSRHGQECHKQHEARVFGANFKPGSGPGDHLPSWHRPHYPGQHPAPPLTVDRL